MKIDFDHHGLEKLFCDEQISMIFQTVDLVLQRSNIKRLASLMIKRMSALMKLLTEQV